MATTGQKIGMAAVLAIAASIAGIVSAAHQLGLFGSTDGTPPTPVPCCATPVSPAYFRATVFTPPGYVAYVYSVPSLSAPMQGELANGVTVRIECTVQGDVVTANGTTSSLWNRITSGGYMPDVTVNTGTDQPTMPRC